MSEEIPKPETPKADIPKITLLIDEYESRYQILMRLYYNWITNGLTNQAQELLRLLFLYPNNEQLKQSIIDKYTIIKIKPMPNYL